MTEDALPRLLADPLSELLAQLDAAPNVRRVVGIVGPPGAGKSTLAVRLAEAVNRRRGAPVAMALGMDGFHLTRAQLAAFPDPEAARARRGAPWTFDPQALAQRLQRVRAADLQPGAASIGWPGFEHGVGDPVADALQVPPAVRLVLLEGLYLLHDRDGWDLRAWMDVCWFLDTPLETALQRLALRHQQAWGITPEAAARRIDGNDRPNARIVMASIARADARVPLDAACTS